MKDSNETEGLCGNLFELSATVGVLRQFVNECFIDGKFDLLKVFNLTEDEFARMDSATVWELFGCSGSVLESEIYPWHGAEDEEPEKRPEGIPEDVEWLPTNPPVTLNDEAGLEFYCVTPWYPVTGVARRIAARYQCKVELSFEEDTSGLYGFSEYCYCPETKQVVVTEDYQRWRKSRNRK
jgi:hypothetical protein